jgi:hypothetical protein
MVEETTNATTTEQQAGGTPDYSTLFEKLDAILDKRSDGIARSALKDNGIAEDEAKEIVTAYRQQKAGAAQHQSETLAALQQENAQLKAQILQSKLNAEAMTQAGSLNVAPETVPYLIRLADLSGAVDENGTINKDAVAASLGQVLEDIPALKLQASQSKGFVLVGGDGTGQQTSDQENQMRRYFGLEPKK